MYIFAGNIGKTVFPNFMPMRVKSSNIKTAEYDKRTHLLILTFINRPTWVYIYKAVPPKIWTGFMRAKSKGQYFANNIKEEFNFTRSIGKTINGKTKRNI